MWMACKLCKVKKVRAHRAGMLDHALGALHVYPYRCPECDNRFYSPGTPREPAARNPGMQRVLLAFGGAFLCCALLIYLIIR